MAVVCSGSCEIMRYPRSLEYFSWMYYVFSFFFMDFIEGWIMDRNEILVYS